MGKAFKEISEAMRELSRCTDIHLSIKKPMLSIFFPDQSSPDESMLPILGLLAAEVIRMDDQHNARQAGPDMHSSFMVDFQPDGERGAKLSFRVQPLMRGDSYAMRQSMQKVLEYGVDVKPPAHIGEEVLMKQDLQRAGGLILISGSTGVGKTTLAYAAIIERLKRFGGYCLAIEDPTEFQGAYGQHRREVKDANGKVTVNRGFLAQIDASQRGGYASALKDGLRSIPITKNRSIVFIGEIRDPETAAEMLRFSISGALVFTTVHAEDHDSACQRLISLAQQAGEPDARHLLQKSLQGSINLRMSTERAVQYSSLSINAKIRQAIGGGNYAEFASEMKQQQMMIPTSSRMPSRSKMEVPD